MGLTVLYVVIGVGLFFMIIVNPLVSLHEKRSTKRYFEEQEASQARSAQASPRGDDDEQLPH